MVALRKHTGEPIWKCAVPAGDFAAYASALVMNAGGVKQYVQFVSGGLIGVEARTGKLLTLSLHPSVTGRPFRIKSLENGLQYICERSGVWKATAGQIAEWYRSQI